MAEEKGISVSEAGEAVAEDENEEGWYCIKCDDFVEAKINTLGFPLCPVCKDETMWIY